MGRRVMAALTRRVAGAEREERLMSSFRSRVVLALAAAAVVVVAGGAPAASASPSAAVAAAAPAAIAPAGHSVTSTTARNLPRCSSSTMLCTEVYDSESVFGAGNYVGHDEPSVLFYSNHPGAGNHDRWTLTIPKDPPHAVVPGRTWNFQLHPAFWFGMALCDTQSYPEQVSTCTPSSDTNITPLAKHPGTAFMELQFYPPGWVKQFASQSCDNTQWCAALTIDSLSRDPVNGADLNPTCQNQILGGVEYVNFAFVTRNGVPTGPPNPLDFNPLTSGAPDPVRDLFMNPGDQIEVTMADTAHGLRIDLNDRNTGQTGFMVASAQNNFGQIKFAPTGTSCTVTPYDFHPMYSTSSPQTRVPWAAHSYNIAFSDELGHWDYCSIVDANGNCALNATEGDAHANSNTVNDSEPAEGPPTRAKPALDDVGCFNPPPPPAVQVSGCNGQNNGWDGVPYLHSWPDGNTDLHPTAIMFSSPRTGNELQTNYRQAAFETDLPRTETATCNRTTGVGCTLIPTTDDNVSADFYPFFSVGSVGEACRWAEGSYIPGFTQNDFGGNVQYGPLLNQDYLAFGGHGAIVHLINDFRQILPNNPCRAGQGGGD
jgi:hypothetical protein